MNHPHLPKEAKLPIIDLRHVLLKPDVAPERMRNVADGVADEVARRINERSRVPWPPHLPLPMLCFIEPMTLTLLGQISGRINRAVNSGQLRLGRRLALQAMRAERISAGRKLPRKGDKDHEWNHARELPDVDQRNVGGEAIALYPRLIAEGVERHGKDLVAVSKYLLSEANIGFHRLKQLHQRSVTFRRALEGHGLKWTGAASLRAALATGDTKTDSRGVKSEHKSGW